MEGQAIADLIGIAGAIGAVVYALIVIGRDDGPERRRIWHGHLPGLEDPDHEQWREVRRKVEADRRNR